jgi:hypothetical protein
MIMTRKQFDISLIVYRCYVVQLYPKIVNGNRGKIIGYKEFKQVDAAQRWLNDPARKLHERTLVKLKLSDISGMNDRVLTRTWAANDTANMDTPTPHNAL